MKGRIQVFGSAHGWLPLLLLLSSLTGCGGGARIHVESQIIPYSQEQVLARESAKGARYRLRVGDRFGISFRYETNLDIPNVLILPDGYIALKGLTTPIKAAGQTIEELDQSLEDAYRVDYLHPDLTIVVNEISSPEIYVLGAVHSPGLYRLPEQGRGILQAVAMAGGFLDDARKSDTVLMRAGDEGFMMRQYDLSGLGRQPLLDTAYFDLAPYDIVYVPQTKLSSFAHLSELVFGSFVKMTGFFWDVYALTNLDKIQTILR